MLACLWIGVAATCFGLSVVRWARVAQREEFCSQRVLAVWRAWWSLGPNLVLAVASLIGLLGSTLWLPLAAAPLAATALGPLGLRFKGTDPGPLRWDRSTVATVAVAATLPVVVCAGAVIGGWWERAVMVALLGAVLSGLLVAAASPIGRMLGSNQPHASGDCPRLPDDSARLGRSLVAAFENTPVAVAAAPDLHHACDALTRWKAEHPEGEHVVVTPGLSSLYASDADQMGLGRAVAAEAELVIVGSTARAAMVRGAMDSQDGATVVAADDAAGVASWWRERTAIGPTSVLILGPRGDHRP